MHAQEVCTPTAVGLVVGVVVVVVVGWWWGGGSWFQKNYCFISSDGQLLYSANAHPYINISRHVVPSSSAILYYSAVLYLVFACSKNFLAAWRWQFTNGFRALIRVSPTGPFALYVLWYNIMVFVNLFRINLPLPFRKL